LDSLVHRGEARPALGARAKRRACRDRDQIVGWCATRCARA